MVPDGVARKALRFLFAEHFVISVELSWYFVEVRLLYPFSVSAGVYCCSSYIVLVRWLDPGNVTHLWEELGALSVRGVQDNW